MNRESASVYLHFKDLEDLLELARQAVEAEEESEEEIVGVVLTKRDVITIAEALDYLGAALRKGDYPCGAIDDLADRISEVLEGMDEG
jgi:uncharacterized membrane protein